MKLKNLTSIPDERLHKMIEFVDPGLAKDVRVVCLSSNKLSRGLSYTDKKEVKIYIPKRKQYPYYRDHGHSWKWVNSDSEINYSCGDTIVNEGPANWKLIRHTKARACRTSGLVLSLDEDIILLLAHELRHQWQRRRPPKSQWAWGCKGKRTKFSVERDASVYQWKKVREWRRIHSPIEVYSETPW